MALCVYSRRNLRREARFTAPASLILCGPTDLEEERGSRRTGKGHGRNPSIVAAIPRIVMELLLPDY